ncbi:hypothetical protein SCB29_02615 [Paraburkholderia sp. SIMBA_055]|jgi:hypothetical protein|uniref:Lipoprotein n=2 Tax=Paraburkholderia graminis TaxID=60548 RepID=B1FSE0_PARG4|nr:MULTISPECIES: hypothetical protein [Paraburkholderia]EDT12678.1 conserved hypothetical protein [Paraburkholderia graminis C4D1M]MDQ0625025.1 hypothetical protein [Paraburkholderia graminis]MDR6206180.1 hypothetical protein [Paraburkholderia graminis]MDR6475682.1 hypothetical protein [Paraburkholderia graminis]PTR01941.1 hypothetical protein C8K19_104244 [Paraburkholderia sp. GV072]
MTLRCRALAACACIALAAPLAWADGDAPKAAGPAGGYNYPTTGRVEYVLACMDDNGHDFANVYKCSCVIDRMATALPYDEFVDQSTFSRYASLGGEGGAEFRVDHAKAQTKKFRALQADAYRSCGLGTDKTAASK